MYVVTKDGSQLREVLLAKYPLPESGTVMCLAKFVEPETEARFICTLPKGHTTMHVAHGIDCVCAVWSPIEWDNINSEGHNHD